MRCFTQAINRRARRLRGAGRRRLRGVPPPPHDDDMQPRVHEIGADPVTIALELKAMPERGASRTRSRPARPCCRSSVRAAAACSVELPIEEPDEGLDDVEDDARSARRAEDGEDLALSSKTMVGAMELRGRLPPSTRLAIGRPSSSTGRNEKSVSWLLSRKPAGPDARAEGAFDRGREGDRVAVGVDDREMARADALERRVDAEGVLLARPAARPAGGGAMTWSRSISARRLSR